MIMKIIKGEQSGVLKRDASLVVRRAIRDAAAFFSVLTSVAGFSLKKDHEYFSVPLLRV